MNIFVRIIQKQILLNKQQNLLKKKVNRFSDINWINSFIIDVNNSTDNTTTTTTTTAPPPKMITIREQLNFTVELLDYADPTSEAQANSIKK